MVRYINDIHRPTDINVRTYTGDGSTTNFTVTESLTERQSFKQFIEQLVSLDHSKALQNCLWNNYSGFVKAIVNNQYLYPPFWSSVRNKTQPKA